MLILCFVCLCKIDEEIESEIRNINDLISNKGNEEMKKPYLLEAAETALGKGKIMNLCE